MSDSPNTELLELLGRIEAIEEALRDHRSQITQQAKAIGALQKKAKDAAEPNGKPRKR